MVTKAIMVFFSGISEELLHRIRYFKSINKVRLILTDNEDDQNNDNESNNKNNINDNVDNKMITNMIIISVMMPLKRSIQSQIG